ncbi:MAG: Eco57I restriction-modification methylase domain-containing protein [Eubacteriaceae bacterium]|nr:Eco57I restriction-modification methylase domain-containing protein [Eubacteriaceae bacterium]
MGKKLFDYVIGNPPYQQENGKNGRQSPVYNLFMDASYSISDCVELITPARFLFNAGQTPKEWNEKMLHDEHFKVLYYESDASKIFSNTEIKGGVAITLRNSNNEYGEIGVFTEYDELNGILHKVFPSCSKSITDICIRGVPYCYTEKLKIDHPEYVSLTGKSFDLRTNAFENLYGKIFFEEQKNTDDVLIYGMYKKKRCVFYIDSRYLGVPENFEKYKVILSKAQGSGKFGEAFSDIIIGEKRSGHTQTFFSMGAFDTEEEAVNLRKYLKTKFLRCMLSVLKKTQDITPYKWKYVPLQDFTSNSDIDWSKTIHDIDLQLYRKYGLDETEIDFIETHVKEMA